MPGQRRRFRSLSLIAAVAALLVPIIAADAPAAGLLIADGGFGGGLEIEEHAVKVTINNGIAVTEVAYEF